MRSVVIEDPAFIGILTAAVEVYNKETFGVLIGRKKNNSYIVKYALSYQAAQRKKSEVEIDNLCEARLNQASHTICSYPMIGDYHSHVENTYQLSKCDKKDMRDSGEGVSLLIVIKKARTKKRWEYDPGEKKLIGSIGKDYTVAIKAYYYDHIKRKISKISIKCPYIRKLNKRLGST